MQLIVFEGKGCNKPLLRWMKRFPRRWRTTPPSMLYDFLSLWRNQQIKHFLAKTDLPWVWLMDDDMVPVAETSKLLESDAHVAGCAYWSRTGNEAHARDGEVGAACLRVSRHALETVGPPWFKVEMNDDGTRMIDCECTFFCRRMREAGFTPVKAGRVGHILSAVFLPGDRPGAPPLVKFL